MVQLENVRKSFSKKLLFEIPLLSLDSGFTCLTGASGCGKTTLGRIICGLEKADSGKIHGIDGASVVLFQESRLLPSLTAYANITAVCRTDEAKRLGRELLTRLLFTDEDMNKRPHELSGGMERRVAIVRAVVFAFENKGSFALLDEPFTGLDPDTRRIAADILKERLDGRTVLVITHDDEECELFGGNAVEFSSLLASNTEI
ncbi:MAG: ATP-binding cassette domain-containing protein [Clostridia bacterium]|nr:ATP-binding cassette domain-containing protein [Clostridia bacterium]